MTGSSHFAHHRQRQFFKHPANAFLGSRRVRRGEELGLTEAVVPAREPRLDFLARDKEAATVLAVQQVD